MTVFLHRKKFKYHHGFVSQETEMVCMEHTDLSVLCLLVWRPGTKHKQQWTDTAHIDAKEHRDNVWPAGTALV